MQLPLEAHRRKRIGECQFSSERGREKKRNFSFFFFHDLIGNRRREGRRDWIYKVGESRQSLLVEHQMMGVSKVESQSTFHRRTSLSLSRSSYLLDAPRNNKFLYCSPYSEMAARVCVWCVHTRIYIMALTKETTRGGNKKKKKKKKSRALPLIHIMEKFLDHSSTISLALFVSDNVFACDDYYTHTECRVCLFPPGLPTA